MAPITQPSRDNYEPFETLHMDYKGEISPPSKLNKNILVIVDAYSKLVHAYPTKSQTAATTIECLEK